MLNQNQKNSYKENGFLVVHNLLSKEEIENFFSCSSKILFNFSILKFGFLQKSIIFFSEAINSLIFFNKSLNSISLGIMVTPCSSEWIRSPGFITNDPTFTGTFFSTNRPCSLPSTVLGAKRLNPNFLLQEHHEHHH